MWCGMAIMLRRWDRRESISGRHKGKEDDHRKSKWKEDDLKSWHRDDLSQAGCQRNDLTVSRQHRKVPWFQWGVEGRLPSCFLVWIPVKKPPHWPHLGACLRKSFCLTLGYLVLKSHSCWWLWFGSNSDPHCCEMRHRVNNKLRLGAHF